MNHPQKRDIRRHQRQALSDLVAVVGKDNRFYRRKFAGAQPLTARLEDFSRTCPLTQKCELLDDQRDHPPFGSNLTFPLDRYTRFHQTSGSTGAPMRWLDTPESWSWMVSSWTTILESVGLGPGDTCFFAFSFGPFLGFWTAFEAGTRRGCLCIPGGGMRSTARLKTILENGVTALFCTPTYAIHLGQVAREEGIALEQAKVKAILVAGEPGGSLPKTRALIESLWKGATVFDHHGMTEVGPVSLPCPVHGDRLHIMEQAYYPEILDPATGATSTPGEVGELVLTGLGRTGSPLLRYRTGDLVRQVVETPCACGRHDLALDGGIMGRVDDMVIVRGVNLYPSAFEEIVRRFPEIEEYQVHIRGGDQLAHVTTEIELTPAHPAPESVRQAFSAALHDNLQLRVEVRLAQTATLPRFELKSKRWHITK